MKKIALVTGASSGIGESTAYALLAAGFTVVAAARRVERMTGLVAAGAIALPLDLTDDVSIVALSQSIKEFKRIDVVINNAGYGAYGSLEDMPLQEARRQFEVNLFGLARLCQLLLPMMRVQGTGRIVNVSSIGGKIWEPYGSWYHATKFALEGLSDCLRMELAPFGIQVVVIEPGAIKTEWNDVAVKSLREISSYGVYSEYANRHADFLHKSSGSRAVSPPETVAKVIVNAVQTKRPRTRYAVGGGAPTILWLAKLLPDRALDALMRIASN
jgi:NAD(P)-dependent dehydrogenase (short-subunit alcohol dehydrogenase family)